MSVDIKGGDAGPLGLGVKLAYAAGGLLDGVANQAVSIFFFFYATTVCGAPSALAGMAIAAGLAVDAAVDPLIGSLSDGWRSRLGRRLPFLLIGAPLTALFLVLIFSLPRALSGAALVAWITMLSIGLRVAMSLFLLPYNAVGAELSEDYGERSSIAAWRWAAAMVGGLLTVVLGFGVFLGGPQGLMHRAAYPGFGLSMAVLAGLGATIAMRAVSLTRARQHPSPTAHVPAIPELLKGLKEIFANRSFRVLFIGAVLLFAALGLHATLGLHANTYFWRLSAAQTQTVTLALFGGLLVGAPLAGPLLKVLEKRTVLLLGLLGFGAAFSLPATLRLLGLLPLEGTALVALLASAVLCGGGLMATAAIAFASMMADAADEHEHLFGARREGLYFAGWAFASKAAAALGALMAGVGLDLVGFHAQPGIVPTAEAIRWVGAIYGLGAGLLAIASAGTCLLYTLTAERHAAILTELKVRRAISAPAAAE
jgi:GPH family glycoside/pentoside/hexuronide:cation symporter